jgi:hypothetical protein
MIILPNILFANDTFVYDNGHAVYPINTDKIRMVSEKISVIMVGKQTNRNAQVTCEFKFENKTNVEIKAKLGFPAEDRYYYDRSEGEREVSPLRDFVSYVNGVEVKVDLRKQIDKGEWKGMYWYTWDVTFPPSGKLSLKNTYKARLSLNYYTQWFEYILKTGANWRGPIERSEIEVIYNNGEDLRRRVIKASPKNFKIKHNKIIWEFTNFIPTQNISVYEKNLSEDYDFLDGRIWDEFASILNSKKYEGSSRYYDENDLNIRHDKRLMEMMANIKAVYVGNVTSENQFVNEVNRYYLKILRNEIFARRGRSFKSRHLSIFFTTSRFKWYKPDPNYSDSFLNDYEKKNVHRILEYEKRLN